MDNHQIASALVEVADLLEIRGDNPFRIRAYRNAARTVGEHAMPLRRVVEEGGDLTELPGIGKDMSAYIRELLETGTLVHRDRLAEEVPVTLAEITRLPGVGPKRTQQLWEELGIETVDELEGAAEAGRVMELDGFGKKTQEKILSGIEQYRRHSSRHMLVEADRLLEPLVAYLRRAPGLERLEVAGSYRRRRETVGDLDLLAQADRGEPVMDHFVDYGGVARVEQRGETRGSVVLSSGVQVDLRIVPAESYGAALVYFTGSKAHNVKLRQRALRRGLSISEYGVFELLEESEEEPADGNEESDEEPAEADDEREGPRQGERIAGATEEEVYASVGLARVAPELREDRGEIEAAEAGELPDLVELADIRGDLHMHTTWSDGRGSIETMISACLDRGYDYCAITDHSQALAMTGGLDAERLRRQGDAIREVAARYPDIRVLRGLEVDILAEGELDMEDAMLEELDLVIVSIHSLFDLSEKEQTERVLRALRHPRVHLLAHPTGRLINRRDPYALDVETVLQCAAEEGVAVELNASPDRLDLKDTHLLRARELDVPVVIDTDAHRVSNLDLMRYGIEQARRAWLTPEHVLNARPVEEVLERLGVE